MSGEIRKIPDPRTVALSKAKRGARQQKGGQPNGLRLKVQQPHEQQQQDEGSNIVPEAAGGSSSGSGGGRGHGQGHEEPHPQPPTPSATAPAVQVIRGSPAPPDNVNNEAVSCPTFSTAAAAPAGTFGAAAGDGVAAGSGIRANGTATGGSSRDTPAAAVDSAPHPGVQNAARGSPGLAPGFLTASRSTRRAPSTGTRGSGPVQVCGSLGSTHPEEALPSQQESPTPRIVHPRENHPNLELCIPERILHPRIKSHVP